MELKPGYEQTEVGVLPEDWRVVSVEDVAIVGRGRVISHRDIARAHNPQFPIYSSQTSNDGVMGYIDTFEFEGEYITWTTDGANAGTVFARNGRFNCTNVCGTIKLTSDSHSFVARVLAGFAPYHVSRHLGNPKLMNDIMKRVKIPLPSTRQEQDAIATALNDVDALLGGLDRLIAKKHDLKQSAMQQLLTGQTRLPGFHDEWDVKMLDDLGSTFGGLTGKTKADFGEGAGRYVTFMNVMTNVVVDCDIFDRVKVTPKESQNRVLKGDLLFNGSSETPEEVAMCSVILADVPDLYLNSFCFGFRFRKGAKVDGLFLVYYVRSWEGREMMKSIAQGSTRYNLSKVALLKSPLRLPSFPEQTAIATVLSDMDAELTALEARRDKTRDIKQAMMQELLTGKTRLV